MPRDLSLTVRPDRWNAFARLGESAARAPAWRLGGLDAFKSVLHLIACIACAIGAVERATGAPIDLSQAKALFAEAQQISTQEHGRLWGKAIYGSLFLVDPDSRAVVANESDREGVLHESEGLYVGTLPSSVIISNAPVEWGGKRWTMLIWPSVPIDSTTRRITLAHELFHRIQPQLGLMAPDSLNLQLDTADGRFWLQLEWRALAAALIEQGAARTKAINDAVAFRRERQSSFPGSQKNEASLEIAEGIPEYTGVVAGSPDRSSARWHAIAKLADPDQTVSFVRFFAYISGPAYGLLLDERMPGWRATLSDKSDVGALLAATLPAQNHVLAAARASDYGATNLRNRESERAKLLEATRARYRSRLVEGATLQLPAGNKFAFSFNPSSLISLDKATVYPTFHATAEWGTLDVTDGVLVPTDFSSATVAAPVEIEGPHLRGPGWTLDLSADWVLVRGSSGDYTARRR